ncbi:hypothetical protein CDN99_09020 [Roseateles aquatilis]|uniref:Uncharacterized protein n=1 Tax=Roseateles aquatilis TaxID=431061 RepID=A0A246JFB5_9BURK|nr:hypothetical protein CDN99_09020 [Roseateles aquatilis]
MTRFGNSGKQRFLAGFPVASLEAPGSDHAARCKFNFSYFCHDPAGQRFSDWSHDKLAGLLDKLAHFGKQTLDHWKQQSIGKSGRVLSIYGGFPPHSDFIPPKHVPHQAQWGRFRLDWAGRLCGFVVPRDLDGVEHPQGGRFCANTFYVVFLDEHHRFYKGRD